MELKMGDYIRTYGKTYEEVESFFKAIQEAGCEFGEGMDELSDFHDLGDILIWDDDNTTYFICEDCRKGDRYRDVTEMFFSSEPKRDVDENGELFRAVVYYTDGSQYTNKDVKEVNVVGDKVFIHIDVEGNSVIDSKDIEAGVCVNTSSTLTAQTVEIDVEHVSGVCTMRKKNGMWMKTFMPFKPSFSVQAKVSGLKEGKSSVESLIKEAVEAEQTYVAKFKEMLKYCIRDVESAVKASSGYILADGSDSGEYRVGNKFVVVGGSCFSRGSVVSLFEDDWSSCPLFKLEDGHCSYTHCHGELGTYEYWEDLIPLNKS